MKILLILLLCMSVSYAQDIGSLLDAYQSESELSKKTKDESAGSLIVYTRDDLERMQVESLKDLLKSLRLYAYIENRMAQTDLLNTDPVSYNSKTIRVYLNEHELLTALTGSGLIFFGDMELDFIDHVEIYQGFPSFEFGIEPATTVIRLYSKTAAHDEGGRVKATMGSYGQNKQNVYYASQTEDLSYFLYANRTDAKLDTYKQDNQTLSRDKVTSRFFGSLTKGNHKVELHAVDIKADAFLGSIVGVVPKSTQIDSTYLNITSSSKFLNDSLKLNLSYINSKNDLDYKYDNNLYLPNYPPALNPVSQFNQTIREEAITASLSKKWEIGTHTLTTGVQYRYKTFDLTDYSFDNIPNTTPQAYKLENVYSAYIEDSYAFNEKNRFVASAMLQLYQRDGNVKDITTTQLRLGYIYSDKEWVSKTFIAAQEFAPEPYMTISPAYGNPNLKSDTYNSIVQEISYAKNRTLTKLILFYGDNHDTPFLDTSTLTMSNHNGTLDGYGGGLEYTLNFRKTDKLELQVNYIAAQYAYTSKYNSWTDYVVRMLNSVKKFDFYNELVINQGYEGVDTGYNYSLGIKYEVNKDLHINIKGDNIFDTGLTHSYYIDGTPTNKIEVPTIERSFFAGIEYLF